MSRQVVLDTETTGLEWRQGHRVVEIGCVELIERRATGRTYHTYINPEREMDAEASQVTGITTEFLLDKPLFSQVVDDFLAFIDGAELLAHNADFDIGFLDYELSRAGDHYGRMSDRVQVEDTLRLARGLYPGKRNSLDALCSRLGIDNTHRDLHGALVDAHLLADVYLAMTSGQGEMGFASEPATSAIAAGAIVVGTVVGERPRVRVSAALLAAHEARLAGILAKAGKLLWPQSRV